MSKLLDEIDNERNGKPLELVYSRERQANIASR